MRSEQLSLQALRQGSQLVPGKASAIHQTVTSDEVEPEKQRIKPRKEGRTEGEG